MEDNYIYQHLKSILKNKLIKNLKKDEEFKDLNIDDLIKRRVNNVLDDEIDFDNINNNPKINEEMYIIKESMRLNKLIEFQQENPKRKDTSAHDRYNRYKHATTYKEFIDLGGRNKAFYYDYKKGYLNIL